MKKPTIYTAVAAAPLLLSESDLHGQIVHYTSGTTLTTNGYWKFSFAPVGSVSVYWPKVGNQLLASYAAGTLLFNATSTNGTRTSPANAVSIGSGGLINSALIFGDYALFDETSGSTLYAFVLGQASNPDNYYGWASISTSSGSVTIHEWALEGTANTAITAGAVPEPADMALGLGALALGAVAVQRRRRREQVVTADSTD